LARLDDPRKLVRCARVSGEPNKIRVTLLREDGSGNDYTPPGEYEGTADRYLRIPTAFWTNGKAYGRLKLPGLAMLLVLLAEKPWVPLPAERPPQWYGWSADTIERGLRELLALGLAVRRESYKEAPLTPTGSTLFHQYNLKRWLRPPAGQRPDRTTGDEGTAK
jgi:hypothetical protein